MTTMEITSKQLLTNFKEWMQQVSPGLPLSFRYKKRNYLVVEQPVQTQGQRLASRMRKHLKKRPINHNPMEEEDIKKLVKGMMYE